jgi:hypothetical protein
MKDPLGTYLHDHLAGAGFAIDLLQSMKERQVEKPDDQFVESLLAMVEEDRDTLQQLADKIGTGPNVLKELTAWIGEKASRVKLGAGLAGDFGQFEALEFLALGITGKLSLWLALQAIAPSDDRLKGIDFERLIVRAEEQYGRAEEQYGEVERRRLSLAVPALAPSSDRSSMHGATSK